MKSYEFVKSESLAAIKLIKETLNKAKGNTSKNVSLQEQEFVKNAGKILDALMNSTKMIESLKEEVKILIVGFENTAKINIKKDTEDAKKIKIISNRRLKIDGVILEYKQIAEIRNNDEAKRCLKSGLITMI